MTSRNTKATNEATTWSEKSLLFSAESLEFNARFTELDTVLNILCYNLNVENKLLQHERI